MMSNKYPKVSLILTTFNCEDNLKRTLDSIDAQDYLDIEVVIVDGKSSDGTLKIIKEYADNGKYECKWISEKDKGLYDAMNKGYKLSTGYIVAFFNDLFLTKSAVSLMVSAIVDNNADGAHADLVYASDDKIKRYWKMGTGKLIQGWLPGHPTLYLKRDIYDKFGLYNINYKCSADYEFMVRILKDDQIKLSYVPKTIIRMYYGGTSTANADSYKVSTVESYKALRYYNVKFAAWIIFMRTLKVVIQFINAGKYKGEWNKCL